MEGQEMKTPIATILGTAALGLASRQRRVSPRLKKEEAINVSLIFVLTIPIHSEFCVYDDTDKVDELTLEIMNNVTEEATGIDIGHITFESETRNTDLILMNGRIDLGHVLKSTTMNGIYKILEDKLSVFINHLSQFADIKGSKRKIKVSSDQLERDKVFVNKNDTIGQIYANLIWFQINTFLKSRKPMREFDIEMSDQKNVLVNVDTGQIYEPPKPSETKLRKR